MTKTCTKCGEDKEYTQFHKNKRHSSGYNAHCKSCRSLYAQQNKVKNYITTRRFRLKNEFNMTLEEYEDKLEKQNFSCAVCHKHMSKMKYAMAVDHCHDTGKIRGLLCSNCNTGIGNLRDSIELLQKAILYLEKYDNDG